MLLRVVRYLETTELVARERRPDRCSVGGEESSKSCRIPGRIERHEFEFLLTTGYWRWRAISSLPAAAYLVGRRDRGGGDAGFLQDTSCGD